MLSWRWLIFIILKRWKEIKSLEVQKSAPMEETLLEEWTRACDSCPIGPYLECVSDFYLPISVNPILQDQGQNSSPPINFVCDFLHCSDSIANAVCEKHHSFLTTTLINNHRQHLLDAQLLVKVFRRHGPPDPHCKTGQ